MRAFLLACVTALVVSGLGALALQSFQTTSEQANTTVGARIDHSDHLIGK